MSEKSLNTLISTLSEFVYQDASVVLANGLQDADSEKSRVEKSRGQTLSPQRPSLEDVKTYCLERKNSVDAEKWLSHYEANGWRVGKNPMKDWKAAVRTWEKSEFNKPKVDDHAWAR